MYLFTNEELPESKWSEEHPGVWIQAAKEGDDRGALKWPHEQKRVYYIGSYQGCGCGWSPANEWDEPEDMHNKQEDRDAFAELMMSINRTASWLVVCWEGDQGEPLLESKVISIQDIRNVHFEFEELRKYEFA